MEALVAKRLVPVALRHVRFSANSFEVVALVEEALKAYRLVEVELDVEALFE